LSLDVVGELILLALLIVLNAFFAAAEVSITNVRKSRLKQLIEQGVQTATVAERLAEESSRFLATTQVGVTLIGFFTAATAAVNLSPEGGVLISRLGLPLDEQASQTVALFLITILLALTMLVFGELVPKNLAVQYAEPVALFVARPLDLLATAFSPLVRLPVFLANLITSIVGGEHKGGMPFVTAEEIKTLVDAGEEGGIIEEDEKEMIYSIFEFGDTMVLEVMVPRVDVVDLEASTPISEALDVIIAAGHSRIPVYKETVDNIVGVLYAKDLLAVLRDGDLSRPLSESGLLRDAYFVPETKKVDELLEELQQSRVHIAIVVDEYGGTAGLVTIEDILEEIVGEIQDEYDSEEPLFKIVSDDEVVFNGRVALDEVNKLMAVELPQERNETLAGLIYSELGRVPAVGDVVLLDGITLTVLQIDGRIIRKVKVARESGPSGEAALEKG
jgi:putative hemolysin